MITIHTHLQDDSQQEVQFKERSRNRGETPCVTLEVVVPAASQSHHDPLWALPPRAWHRTSRGQAHTTEAGQETSKGSDRRALAFQTVTQPCG